MLVSCRAGDHSSSLPRVTTPDYDVVIVGHHQELTPEQIEKIHPQVTTAVSEKLSWLNRHDYKWQYWPMEDGKEIKVTMIHTNTPQVRDGLWLKVPIMVDGGGTHFVEVTYDRKSGKVTKVKPNEAE